MRRRSCFVICVVLAMTTCVVLPIGDLEAERAETRQRLVLGEPTIRGSMPEGDIRRIFNQRKQGLARCLAPAHSDVRLTARVVVAASGVATHVTVLPIDGSHTPPSTSLECLRLEFLEMRFPQTCAGITIIDQPITFSSTP